MNATSFGLCSNSALEKGFYCNCGEGEAGKDMKSAASFLRFVY